MTSESQPRNALGVVLAGIPPGAPEVERFAARGYDVLALELDEAAGVELNLQAVQTAMDALVARPAAGPTAVVGYGAGGRYAYLALTRLGADGAAAIRGTDIGRHLDEASRAKKPLSLHFSDDDERVPFAEVRAIKGALEGFATTEIYRYPVYDATAAEQAERRVFAVLDGLGV